MYLKLLSAPPKIPTSATWEDVLASVRKPASKLSFPDLLATVNAGLSSPLDFEREFLSMQKVRNCLEHRAGVVRKQDLDEDGAALTFKLPPTESLLYARQ